MKRHATEALAILSHANGTIKQSRHSSHPPPSLGDGRGGRGLSHFSEHSYKRDLGQISILGGNWHFGWG